MLVDTTSKSRNSCCSLRWEYPWMMYVPIYRTRRNHAGKMRNRGNERDERRTEKKSEGALNRGNVSATGCRLVSKIQNWLPRRVGDVHAARNKPAGGCCWTNGGGQARRTGKKRRKVEKRREYCHAPIVQRINRDLRIFLHESSFRGALSDDTYPEGISCDT